MGEGNAGEERLDLFGAGIKSVNIGGVIGHKFVAW